MNTENRIKLEIKKLEKERSETIIFFIGIFAAFISASIPILIKQTGNYLIFIGAWIVLILMLLSIAFIIWRNNIQSRINFLYKELGIPCELTVKEKEVLKSKK